MSHSRRHFCQVSIGLFLYAAVSVSAGWAAPITLFNTGVDDGGVPLPDNAVDPHWTLANADPFGEPFGPAAVVATSAGGFPIGPWLGDLPTSAWITPSENAAAGGPEATYVYSTTFTTPGDGLVLIQGVKATDNDLVAVTVDGIAGQAIAGGFDGFASFFVAAPVTGTSHTLAFTVANGPGAGPTGLRVEFTRAEFDPANGLGLFNTGVDSAGVPLADNAIDPHWTLSGEGPASGVGPSAIVATSAGGAPIPPWVGDNEFSAWITPAEDTFGPGASDNSAVYHHSTTFTTSGDGRVTIVGLYSSDDILRDFAIDGMRIPGKITATTAEAFGAFEVVAAVTGTAHTLTFSVLNTTDGSSEEGLRVEFVYTAFDPADQPLPNELGIFNTGVDDDGVPLPDNAVDPHWTLFDVGGQGFGPRAIVATQAGGWPVTTGVWLTDNGRSAWLVPSPDTSAPGGIYEFSTTFSTPAAGMVLIEGLQSNDNFVRGVEVDGIAGEFTSGGFTTFTSFRLLAHLDAGDHTLKFVVENDLAAVPGPTGLRVEITRAEFSTTPFDNELGLFATGVDGNHAALADNAVDPHWRLSGSGAAAGQGPNAIVATSAGGPPIPPWAGDAASSAWITPAANASGPGAGDGSAIYTYTTNFTTPPGKAGVAISGLVATDDALLDIKVDGVSAGTFGPTSAGGFVPFGVSAGVEGTAHTLSFSVTNTATGPQGLRVEIATSEYTPSPPLGLFNTGVDANGATLADDAVDPHWTLEGPGGVPDAIVATSAGGFPIGPWLGDLPTSAWITPSPSTNGDPGNYRYIARFTTPGAGNGRVRIEGRQATDDALLNVEVDGVAGTFTSAGFGGFSPFAVTADVAGTEHTLSFTVPNGSAGPTGLRVEIDLADFTPTLNELGIYNTGVDDDAAPLLDNAVDPHWTLTGIDGTAGFGPDALVATSAGGFPIGPWLADNNTSAWIAPTADTNAPGGIFEYSTTFTTPGDGKILINGLQAADNFIRGVEVDGVRGLFADTGFGSFGGFFVLTNVTGTQHTLKLVIENADGGLNPTGLRVEITQAEFEPDVVPENQIPIFNTGVDDNGVALEEDATDPHYTLSGTGPAAGVGPNAVVATSVGQFPIPPWLGDLSSSAWITPGFDTNGPAAVDGSAIYEYKTVFSLPVDHAVIHIEGLYAADNGLVDVQLNGVSGTFTPGGFSTFSPFSISSEVSGDEHSLSFFVQNGQGESNDPGPTGVRVEFLRATYEPIGVPIHVFNTGVDNAGVPLGDNAVDPHYTLSGSGPAAGQGPQAIVATSSGGPPIPPWLGDNAESAWITPSAGASGPGATDGTALYRYETTFTTVSSGTVLIEGLHASDSELVEVSIDGVPGSFTPTGADTLAPFRIQTPVLGSHHTLTFVVQNGAGQASPDGPTGLRVEISRAEFYAPAGCPDPFADVDRDGDVDQADFGAFQACWTGELTAGALAGCRCFDRDANDRIDSQDYQAFLQCSSGPAVVAAAGCDD